MKKTKTNLIAALLAFLIVTKLLYGPSILLADELNTTDKHTVRINGQTLIDENDNLWMWGNNIRRNIGTEYKMYVNKPTKVQNHVKSTTADYTVRNNGNVLTRDTNRIKYYDPLTDSIVTSGDTPVKVFEDGQSVSDGAPIVLKQDGELWSITPQMKPFKIADNVKDVKEEYYLTQEGDLYACGLEKDVARCKPILLLEGEHINQIIGVKNYWDFEINGKNPKPVGIKALYLLGENGSLYFLDGGVIPRTEDRSFTALTTDVKAAALDENHLYYIKNDGTAFSANIYNMRFADSIETLKENIAKSEPMRFNQSPDAKMIDITTSFDNFESGCSILDENQSVWAVGDIIPLYLNYHGDQLIKIYENGAFINPHKENYITNLSATCQDSVIHMEWDDLKDTERYILQLGCENEISQGTSYSVNILGSSITEETLNDGTVRLKTEIDIPYETQKIDYIELLAIDENDFEIGRGNFNIHWEKEKEPSSPDFKIREHQPQSSSFVVGDTIKASLFLSGVYPGSCKLQYSLYKEDQRISRIHRATILDDSTVKIEFTPNEPGEYTIRYGYIYDDKNIDDKRNITTLPMDKTEEAISQELMDGEDTLHHTDDNISTTIADDTLDQTNDLLDQLAEKMDNPPTDTVDIESDALTNSNLIDEAKNDDASLANGSIGGGSGHPGGPIVPDPDDPSIEIPEEYILCTFDIESEPFAQADDVHITTKASGDKIIYGVNFLHSSGITPIPVPLYIYSDRGDQIYLVNSEGSTITKLGDGSVTVPPNYIKDSKCFLCIKSLKSGVSTITMGLGEPFIEYMENPNTEIPNEEAKIIFHDLITLKGTESDSEPNGGGISDVTALGSSNETKIVIRNKQMNANVAENAIEKQLDSVQSSKEKNITLDLTTNEIIQKGTINIPKTAFNKLQQAKMVLTIKTNLGNIEISNETLDSILKQMETSNLQLIITQKSPSDIIQKKTESISSIDLIKSHIVEVTLSSGGKNITQFAKNTITVDIPVDAENYIDGKSYQVIVISQDGTIELKTGHAIKKMRQMYIHIETTHLSTFVTTSLPIIDFQDVKKDAWYRNAVYFVVGHHLLKGTSDTIFAPNLDMTRSMFISALYRLEGEPEIKSTKKFLDVAENAYYKDAVTWASQNGIVRGYGNAYFGSDDPLTREQLATILYNYAAYKKYNMSFTKIDHYLDNQDISSYSLVPIQWAVANKLINGTSSDTLSPKKTATRAETAAILMRFVTLQV